MEFAEFLKDCGYKVVSDTVVKDWNSKYLEPVQRGLDDKDQFTMERFVVAKQCENSVSLASSLRRFGRIEPGPTSSF